MKKGLIVLWVMGLVFGTVEMAGAWQITAQDVATAASAAMPAAGTVVDLGTNILDVGGVNIQGTNNLALKELEGYTGLGVLDGYVSGEIDNPEAIVMTFAATAISEITLDFLFENGNYADLLDEQAIIEYQLAGSNTWYQETFSIVSTGAAGSGDQTGLVASWTGSGSFHNVSPSINGEAGVWQIVNPFGALAVTALRFSAPDGPNDNYPDADFSIGSVNTPEPGTLLLLGAGLLGLVGFGRKLKK
jgi:hypothetical protein